MLDLKLLPQAIKDLEDIYEYSFENWGLNQADKYQDELYKYMTSIASNPNIGSTYYFKEGNYKKLLANRHLIFYRQTNKDLIVIRILHGQMDLKKHL